MSEKPGIIRQTTASALAEARELIASATHAALAAIEPESGHPLASRVGLASLADGTPFTFISALAAHTAALEADPRCSLLIGHIGKGDPLAQPRLTLSCHARFVARGDPLVAQARTRYLEAHRRAAIYVDLPDFSLVLFDLERVSFNAGFGKAYRFSGRELDA